MKEIIDILPYVIDEKYWSVNTGTHMTHHMYRNSPYETDDNCCNCNGAGCKGCKKITETKVECSIPANEYEYMLIKAGMDEDEASNYAYLDYPYHSKKYIHNFPNEDDLQRRYPVFYSSLIVNNAKIVIKHV